MNCLLILHDLPQPHFEVNELLRGVIISQLKELKI